MLRSIRKFTWNLKSLKSKQAEEDKSYKQEFYDLPDPKERAVMTPEKLAILLNQQRQGTAAHILIEHELNIRIAQIQARAAYRASYIGMVGIVVGAVLTAFLTAWLQKPPPNEIRQTNQATTERNTDSTAEHRTNKIIPDRVPTEVPSVQQKENSAETQKTNTKK
jgi:hypothetical protein